MTTKYCIFIASPLSGVTQCDTLHSVMMHRGYIDTYTPHFHTLTVTHIPVVQQSVWHFTTVHQRDTLPQCSVTRDTVQCDA